MAFICRLRHWAGVANGQGTSYHTHNVAFLDSALEALAPMLDVEESARIAPEKLREVHGRYDVLVVAAGQHDVAVVTLEVGDQNRLFDMKSRVDDALVERRAIRQHGNGGHQGNDCEGVAHAGQYTSTCLRTGYRFMLNLNCRNRIPLSVGSTTFAFVTSSTAFFGM